MTASIGEQLKQARLEKGMSLDQASQLTRIRKFYLEALEGDRKSELPSNVQGRGFLRLYAGTLGLPVEPLLAVWEGKSGSQPIVESPAPIPTSQQAATPVSETLPLLLQPAPETVIQPAVDSGDGNDSASIFREIGVKLRSQREALGLSLVEVERYTRLRQHYIIAMEEGKMENMPSPVQGRGMLSNYAAFLNLDEEKILLRFAEGLQVRRVERIPKAPPPGVFSGKKKAARQAPIWRRFLTTDLVFGVGLAAIILFFILWTAARIDNLRHTTVEPTTPAIADLLLSPVSTRSGEASPTRPTGQPATTSEVTGEAFQPDLTSPPPLATATLPAPEIPTGAAGAAFTPTIPPMNDDPLQVYIVARQRAWLRIIADDKIKFLGRVVPGNAYAFSGTQKVELLTGNASALQIFFNQTDLGILGDMGQVVGLIFVPEGIITPTPAFPPTATPTKAPTITALPTGTPRATATVTPFIPAP